MKDLYSFSRTEAEHEEFYKKITAAYQRIFERIGIGAHTLLTYASGGSFSRFSHEFQTRTAVGEDTIHICSKCNIAVNHEISAEHPTCPQCSNELAEERAVEVGNIFTLGTRFSDALGLRFRDEKGVERSVFMGSYGIGPARLLGVIAELLSDEKGLVLPTHLAPYRVHLLALPGARGANALEGKLEKSGVDVLHDDRACAAGEKFADADLIGLPIRAVLSAKIPTGKVEIKERTASTPRIISHTELLRYV
jgi:prolyl-tRNA synthetase